MADILKILTDDEIEFIRHHRIAPEDIYDARNEVQSVYHDKAKRLGCNFVINICQMGHRLKTRTGHCIVCNPARISFQKRESGSGIVYVAINGKYVKVGMVDNNMKSFKGSLDKREYTLNTEGGYGGLQGWETIKAWSVDKNVGRIESEAHRLLQKYSVEKDYVYSGNKRNAKELFVCSVAEAVEAVKKAMQKYSES